MYTTILLAAIASGVMAMSGVADARSDGNRAVLSTAASAEPQALRSAAQNREDLQRPLLGKWRTERKSDRVVETLEFCRNGTLIRIVEDRDEVVPNQRDIWAFDMIDEKTMRVTTRPKSEGGKPDSRKVFYSVSGTLLAEPDSLREQEGLGLATRGR